MKAPTINDCKRLAKYYGCDAVMVVVVDNREGQTAGASYGRTVKYCRAMAKHLDTALDKLNKEGVEDAPTL